MQEQQQPRARLDWPELVITFGLVFVGLFGAALSCGLTVRAFTWGAGW